MCTALGQTSSTTSPCTAGNYCPAGNLNPVPCPPGAYCPAGSENYINCPVGTFSDSNSATTVSTCLPCPANYYCAGRGLTSTSYNFCGDGF